MWMQECATCAPAQVSGIQTWMKHLTEVHPLPTEWPSDRASRLTGQAAMKPYTTITESKKRRKKDSIPRPLNSFMVSRSIHSTMPNVVAFTLVPKDPYMSRFVFHP
ncbi:unnamed protein product [Dibothriocephalus latus]|uniref:Uncharacterized protein n=1 Tax=Dibothriocephalus latus TaxID=60516 RepID=A0A3P7MY62_DIBLA|nr:unnamed protein product [Dibothriocephalus latus]